MKKILTAILTAALLISSAGCQAKQPQAAQNAPEPASQSLVLNVESPTKIADDHIEIGRASCRERVLRLV